MQSNVAGAAALAADQTLTSSELDQANLYLEQTRSGVVGAMKGLSEAQWTFKTAPDRWSIAEIVEHIIFVQELVLGPFRAQLAAAPALPAGRDYKLVDAIVVNQIPNRLTKFPAPPATHPTGKFAAPEALDRLKENYVRLTNYLESTPDLRQHGLEAAPLKAISNGAYESMDGYQWILAAAAHTERHTKQMLEVMADARFPEK